MQPKPVRLMDHREFPILYVDDEPDNLRIFQLTFRRQFTILTAESPEVALRLLHENPVSVVLSDYRMPGMNGVDFLTAAREIDDRCIRMLVTAYGDVQILGDAINDGRVYRYIAKPWEPEDMQLTLRRAIETYAIERERQALLDELLLLNRLSQQLYRELDLNRLVPLVLAAAHNELGFDGAMLGLLDCHGERVSWMGFEPDDAVAEHVREIDITSERAPNFMNALGEGRVQWLKIEEVDDQEEPVRRWMTEVSADEIIVMPLVSPESVIGFLAVDQRSGSRRFGADERTLLDGLASQLVVAIENARLVEKLRSTREQVKRADRLGTLGTLAAGLAHEINNPLVSIHTFLSLAPQRRSDADPEFWGRYHELACAELERIRGLVSTMSALARGGMDELKAETVDLGELVRRVGLLLDAEAKEAHVDLRVHLSEGALPVRAVKDHIHQMIINLTCNAIHATPAGGTVSLEVVPDRDHPRDVMCLEVHDTGCGMTPEVAERIFDPFFTTKDPDRGTGLGLMITHQIVADHGGSIEVRSEPGEGSSFRVKLPVKGVAGR